MKSPSKSKKALYSIAILAGILTAGAVGAGAQEAGETIGSPWTVGAELDLNSRYIWRSLVWNDKAVGQPSVWLGRRGWTFSVWSNFVLGPEPNRRQFNEIDLRLSSRFGLGPFEIEPAVNVYAYPNQDPSENPATGEFEIQVSAPLGPLTLETAHFLDFWKNPGGYVGELGLEYETEPAAGVTLAAAARIVLTNAKFSAFYIPFDRGGFHSVVLELGCTFPISESVTVRPHIEWNRLLDAGVRAAVAGSSWVAAGRASVFNAGLAVAFERGLRDCP